MDVESLVPFKGVVRRFVPKWPRHAPAAPEVRVGKQRVGLATVGSGSGPALQAIRSTITIHITNTINHHAILKPSIPQHLSLPSALPVAVLGSLAVQSAAKEQCMGTWREGCAQRVNQPDPTCKNPLYISTYRGKDKLNQGMYADV